MWNMNKIYLIAFGILTAKSPSECMATGSSVVSMVCRSRCQSQRVRMKQVVG